MLFVCLLVGWLDETFCMKYEKFSVVWPTYMDSTKTISKGRRLSKEDAVEEPSVYEISEALQSLQIRHVLQPYKGYPPDVESRWDNPGRVLVDMDGYKQKQQQTNNHNDDDIPVMEYDADTDDLTMIQNEEEEEEEHVPITKLTLMRELAKRIPHTQARVKKLEEKERQLRLEKQKQAEANRAAAAAKIKGTSTNSGTNKSKKKGKKKR